MFVMKIYFKSPFERNRTKRGIKREQMDTHHDDGNVEDKQTDVEHSIIRVNP